MFLLRALHTVLLCGISDVHRPVDYLLFVDLRVAVLYTCCTHSGRHSVLRSTFMILDLSHRPRKRPCSRFFKNSEKRKIESVLQTPEKSLILKSFKNLLQGHSLGRSLKTIVLMLLFSLSCSFSVSCFVSLPDCLSVMLCFCFVRHTCVVMSAIRIFGLVQFGLCSLRFCVSFSCSSH